MVKSADLSVLVDAKASVYKADRLCRLPATKHHRRKVIKQLCDKNQKTEKFAATLITGKSGSHSGI